MINATKRRPYTPPMTGSWWRHLGFYRFYMLREATAIPAIWFSLELIGGAVMFNGGEADWARFVAFLQHPLVLVLNIVSLLAALLHTVTWFQLAPKASIIVVGDHKLPPQPIVTGLWVVTALFSLALLACAYFY
ncbi:fumarate reductase subunit FrdC [Candidatus Sodalis sp. SoCistrobi]|uniref:fumarate reductase subunit FrdC n=1 Tax=Candidatus Sodalis sp. SoCistrobi TaxID=1922216 RepID=UPI00093C292C|nr:fumarate reductase subunit FrdC [Candidatus Sodalis sp. SoCistrobi]